MNRSVQAAISFESAFAGVIKTIDANAAGYEQIRRELIELSRQIPLTFEELSRIAEL